MFSSCLPSVVAATWAHAHGSCYASACSDGCHGFYGSMCGSEHHPPIFSVRGPLCTAGDGMHPARRNRSHARRTRHRTAWAARED